MDSITCLKQRYLQLVASNQTVYILMTTREIQVRFFRTWIGFNITMGKQYQRAEKIIEITNNTSFFGKANWVAKLIHNNLMSAIIEDSNTCTPLKYINRQQVKLKLLNTKKKHFMKISLLQQIKIGTYSFNFVYI